MKRRLSVLTVAAVVALLVGCSSGGSDAKDEKATTTTVKATTTSTTEPRSNEDAPNTLFADGWPKGSGGTCDGHEPGKKGVVMTFCKGPAEVVVRVGSVVHPMRGVCWINAGGLEVDAGVAAGVGFKGPWPDAVTFRGTAATGPNSATLSMWIDGKHYLSQDGRGSVSAPGKGDGITVDDALAATGKVAIELGGRDILQGADLSVQVTCS